MKEDNLRKRITTVTKMARFKDGAQVEDIIEGMRVVFVFIKVSCSIFFIFQGYFEAF